MKMRIKVHETNGEHHGYIEWIEKLGLGYLPVKDRRKRRTNDECRRMVENLRIITHGNVTESPQLGFSSRKQFSSANLREYEVPRRLNPFLFTPPPIYSKIGEELATQLAQASKVASSRSNRLLEEESGRPKWAWLIFVPPFYLMHPLILSVILFP